MSCVIFYFLKVNVNWGLNTTTIKKNQFNLQKRKVELRLMFFVYQLLSDDIYIWQLSKYKTCIHFFPQNLGMLLKAKKKWKIIFDVLTYKLGLQYSISIHKYAS